MARSPLVTACSLISIDCRPAWHRETCQIHPDFAAIALCYIIGMRVFTLSAVLLVVSLVGANSMGVPTRDPGFQRDHLLRTSSLQLTNPSGFQVQQSYTFQYTSSSFGSQSTGVYLNTLSYQFGIPLTLSVDIGLYNLFHASGQQSPYSTPSQSNAGPSDTKPEVLFPRIGLDYRPTQNVLLSVQFLNMPDAYRAYGPYPMFRSPYQRW